MVPSAQAALTAVLPISANNTDTPRKVTKLSEILQDVQGLIYRADAPEHHFLHRFGPCECDEHTVFHYYLAEAQRRSEIAYLNDPEQVVHLLRECAETVLHLRPEPVYLLLADQGVKLLVDAYLLRGHLFRYCW